MNKILYLERIRNLREDSDYSQAEVAYKVSMDYICCLTDKK